MNKKKLLVLSVLAIFCVGMALGSVSAVKYCSTSKSNKYVRFSESHNWYSCDMCSVYYWAKKKNVKIKKVVVKYRNLSTNKVHTAVKKYKGLKSKRYITMPRYYKVLYKKVYYTR